MASVTHMGAPIARGRTAEVFTWKDGQVLKLFFDWVPPVWVETEAKVSRLVYEAGLPSPAIEGLVEVNGRPLWPNNLAGRGPCSCVVISQTGNSRNGDRLIEDAMNHLPAKTHVSTHRRCVGQ